MRKSDRLEQPKSAARDTSMVDSPAYRQAAHGHHEPTSDAASREKFVNTSASALGAAKQHDCCFFDRTPLARCTVSANGSILKINRAAERLLFGDKQAKQQASLMTCFVLQDQAVVTQYLRAESWGERELWIEACCIEPVGGARHVQIISLPDRSEDGHIASRSVILLDITERKVAEARLQLINKASEALASSQNYAVGISAMLMLLRHEFAYLCFVDLHLPERDVTRLYPAMMGSEQESIYAAMAEAFAPQGRRDTLQAQVWVSHQPVRSSAMQEANKGGHARRAILVVPLSAHGKTLGTLTCVANRGQVYTANDLDTALDLGHRVALAVRSGVLYESAQEAVHARQMILATVSHDAKNVLTSIKMRGEILLDSQDPLACEQGRAIDRLAMRMDKMLDDLMDIASIERGQLSMRPDKHCVAALIAEAIEAQQAQALDKNIRVEAPASSLRAFCDAERFLQVLSNLLSNAIKFSPSEGLVTVSIQAHDDVVQVGVTDQGPGIAREQLERVFDQYWQAPQGRTGGRGLGLAISQGIVRAGGGQIWVDSHLGQGSTFYFTCPLAAGDKKEASQQAQRDTILVVEDNDDLRLAACEILRKEGFRVLDASDGREGLRLSVAEPRPSLVLLDLEMPIFTGWDFLRRRDDDPSLRDLKVVVMSGMLAAKNAVAQRGAKFLPKPLRAQQLIDEIKVELQQPPS